MKAHNKKNKNNVLWKFKMRSFSTKKNLIITRKYYEPKKMVISVSELLLIESREAFLILFSRCLNKKKTRKEKHNTTTMQLYEKKVQRLSQHHHLQCWLLMTLWNKNVVQ